MSWLAVALVAAACAPGARTPASVATTPATAPTTVPASTTTTAPPLRPAAGPALLREGDAGPLVGALLFALACNGYATPVPGDAFDDDVTGAVRAAQADLGWVATGEPDLDFMIELAALCPADRRLSFPTGGTVSVVGVAAPGETANFLVRAEAGQTLTATVEPEAASVGVGPAGEGVAVPAGAGEWTGRIPVTDEYRIAVAVVEPTVFSLAVRLPSERQATPGTVTIGADGYGVDYVCVAAAGDLETHWAGFGGGVGRLRVERAGDVAADVAVDLATGTYEADLGRLTLSRRADLLAGDGPVTRGAGEVLDVLFALDVSNAGRCPQLRGDGLGSVAFGATVTDAITALAPVLGPPTEDSGWVRAEPAGCLGDDVRFVEFGEGLTLTFTDAGSPYAGLGVRHFSFWTAVEPTIVQDTSGAAPGEFVGRLVGATPPTYDEASETWLASTGGGAAQGGVTYALTGPEAGSQVQAMFAGATPCGR